MTEFKFPDVGEGITEGEIVKWRVKEGDSVKQDQVLCEVETDKAIVEIPSPQAGKILKLHKKEGDVVKVGETLVTFGGKGEKVKEVLKKPIPKKSTSVVGVLEEALPEKKLITKQVLAVPAVRKLAKDKGLDIEKIPGSGPEGRVLKEDVEKFAEHGEGIIEERKEHPEGRKIKVVKKYDMWGYVERVPLRGIRRATANRMIEAKTKAALVTHMDVADVTELVNIRNKEKVNAEKEGIKLTYLPFIIKAVIEGLKEHHYVNSSIDEETEEIVLKKYFNIGVAVDTPDGLMVPVIKGADQKSIMNIAKEIMSLADKAKQRKLDLMDMKGGSFTITNVGGIGGVYATPIVNFPEAAILATGGIKEHPLVRNGKIEVRKILPLSLTFDHRIFDGAEAARFVNDVKKHLEDPDLLLIEL